MITGFKNRFEQSIEDGTKKHIICEDENDVYKKDNWLSLVSEGMKSYRLRCTGTQNIQILYGNGGYFEGFAYQDVRVLIDGRELGFREVSELAKNGGFDMQDSFFKWFNKDFTGKIIHWTNLKY